MISNAFQFIKHIWEFIQSIGDFLDGLTNLYTWLPDLSLACITACITIVSVVALKRTVIT